MIQLGQVVISSRRTNEKFTFIGFKGNKLLIVKPGHKDFTRMSTIPMDFIVKGAWKTLDEFDMETLQNYNNYQQEKAMKEMNAKNAVFSMRKGQIFIGGNGKRYAFMEMKRTRFDCSEVIIKDGIEVADLTFGTTSAKPLFVKEVTQEFAKNRYSTQQISFA